MTTQQLVKLILHPENKELKQLAEQLLYKSTANERKELTSIFMEHTRTQ